MEIVQATHVRQNKWTVRRDTDSGGGNMLVKVNDFTYATLHYDYTYTSNAEQWRVAEAIARSLMRAGDTLDVIGRPPAPEKERQG